MCSLQFMSLLMVTPRYLAVLTVSSICPCSSYWCPRGFLLRVTGSEVHFPGWKAISHHFSHSASWLSLVVGSGHRGRSPLCMRLCHPQRSEFGLSRFQEGHWCKWGTSRVPAWCPLVVHKTGRWQTTACLLLSRKSEIHLLISPWLPYWLSLWIKRLWLTLLKALAKSTMRMSVCCPCARFFIFFFPKMPTIMLMIIPFSISFSANSRNCVLKDLFFRNSCCWLHSMLFRSRWSMMVIVKMCSSTL